MSDNTTLNTGTGGDVTRTLDRLTGGIKTPVVQLDVGGSNANAESLVSSSNPLPSYAAPNTATGTIAATGQSVSITTRGAETVYVYGVPTSVTVNNLAFEGSLDGTNWEPLVSLWVTGTVGAIPDPLGTASGAVTSSAPALTTGGLRAIMSCATFPQVRLRNTSFTGTSFAVTMVAASGNAWTRVYQGLSTAQTNGWYTRLTDINGTNVVGVKAASTAAAFTDTAMVVDARPGGAMLTASAAMADAFANPTLGKQAVVNMVYNGATWDLQRGMSGNLTTGDTGAKVATGNGATIANVGNKGVQVLVNMGAVSGTTPTCVIKLQGSTDGGTTWFDIPGATTASLTATGQFGITVYPGLPTTAGTTTSGTTAQCNAVLPRTWRAVWTIGGTTPSFTITAIQYNYLPN